jgi:putative ABC transport system permease protein
MKSSSRDLNLSLARWSIKEIRSGQLWSITLALSLIIASVFALSALTQRLQQVVVKQGKDALMGDIVYVSANPIPLPLSDAIVQEQLQTSSMTRFSTMLFSGDQMQLVLVKAVDDTFPLQGVLRLLAGKQEYHQVKSGEVWLEQRLFTQLNVKVGDPIAIGDWEGTVTGAIVEEPGLSFNPFRQMPTVFIHQHDVPRTGAVQLGSRVEYRLFINAKQPQIERLKQSVVLTASDEWRDVDRSSRTADIFESTKQYLSLSVIIVIMMAATTLILTCQHYVTSRSEVVAMLKSLGASRRWIMRWLLIQLSLLFLIGLTIGTTVGWGLEYLLRLPLRDLLPTPLPSFGWIPFATSTLLALVIAVPALCIPLARLVNVDASAVLGHVNTMRPAQRWSWTRATPLLTLIPLLVLALFYYANPMMWMLLLAVVVIFFLLSGISLVWTKGLARLPLSPSFKLALSRINRSKFATAIQFGALSISLMLLAILWLVRTDLLSDWQRVLPNDAADVFAFNIAEAEQLEYRNALDQYNLPHSPFFPMTRGRLAMINGVDAKQFAGGEQKSNALQRELNFSWGASLPTYNRVIQGQWTDSKGVSVESQVASDLGITIGDSLTFTIGGQTIAAPVNSIREVEWRDMKPNFFFIFTPDLMKSMPTTYLVSYRVSTDPHSVLERLAAKHPTVSVMDLRVMLDKVQALLTQIVWAISILGIVGVCAGMLLIVTLLRQSITARRQEIHLYRILGTTKRRISATIWAEFGLLSVISGLIASLAADLAVAAIIKFGFKLQAQSHWWLWIFLPCCTFILLSIVVKSVINKLLSDTDAA